MASKVRARALTSLRRILLTVALATVALTYPATEGSAQAHYTSRVSLGVKGGADIARMFFNPSVKQSFKPGAMAGFMFRYVEESHFGLIAELNFIQRGWKENFEGEPFSYERTLDYLQLPVLAHIYFGRRGKFFINVGPEIGVRLSQKVKSDFEWWHASELPGFPKYHQTMQYNEKITQRLDYGISAGLGGEFSINPHNSLNLEVRFYYGLGNLFGASRKDNFNGSNSMALEFTLGYWLRIK